MPESLPRKFSATRSPVRIARSGPRDDGDDGHALDGRAVLDEGLEPDVRVERAEHRLYRVHPADDPGLLQEELRGAERVRLHGRLGGDVAGADVLGERGVDDPLEGVGRYSHVSSLGS